PDGYRTMLADQLRKQGVQNVKEVLSHPNHALVVVEAVLAPGAAKGDPLDVEVKLPAGSRATSLRGGYLKKCVLFNYDFTHKLSPQYAGPQSVVKGHPVAHAEGPVLVGVGLADGDEAASLKQGRIWAGGRARVDQPLALMMTPDQQFARVSALVADRVNETFQGGLRPADAKLAVAKNNLAVALRVPPQYRLNLPRFLRVVRL